MHASFNHNQKDLTIKKILFFTRPIAPPWDEASKNFAYGLSNTINGYDISILTNKFSEHFGSKATKVPIYTSNDLNKVQKARLFSLKKSVDNFDIVHSFFTPTTQNSFFIRKFILKNYTAKTVQTIATLKSINLEKDPRKVLYGDLIVTYSDFSRKKLENAGFDNVKTIYPGISLDHYSQKRIDKPFANRLGIKKGDFIVTYPGEYVRLGATDLIVEALPELIRMMPNLKFVFACRIKNQADVKKKAEVQKILKDNGLDRNVIYTDTVPNMVDLYNLSDLIVFPVVNMFGKFDVPLAVIEAMACAKPIIISDLPVLREFTSADNAMVIPPSNRKSFIEGIVRIYGDQAKSRKLGKKARSYIESRFDIKVVAKEYEDTYNQLLVEHA